MHLRLRPYRQPMPEEKAMMDHGKWVTFCASPTPEVMREIDAKVEILKRAGDRKMNRSKLIRIAVAKLDMPALIKERAL